MEYEWDENKRQENLRKHSWDFADAPKVWSGEAPVDERYSERKGEDRWFVTGKVGPKTVCIVYEDITEDRKRIISMRNATAGERQEYERLLLRETGRAERIFEKLEREEHEPGLGIDENVRRLFFGDRERRLREEQQQREKRQIEKQDREDRER